MNRAARDGKSVKRFERSHELDIALYKNYLVLLLKITTLPAFHFTDAKKWEVKASLYKIYNVKIKYRLYLTTDAN